MELIHQLLTVGRFPPRYVVGGEGWTLIGNHVLSLRLGVNRLRALVLADQCLSKLNQLAFFFF